MNFSKKQIQRSIREFQDLAENMLTANSRLYQGRVEKLVRFIKNDEIMKVIIHPFLGIDVNYDDYVKKRPGGWYDISLPKSKDQEIALTLEILFDSVEQNYELDAWGMQIFPRNSYDEVIKEINDQVLEPVFKELFNRLNDLMEDEIEGKDQIDESSLTIINVGNINASNSSVAVGSNIRQNTQIGTTEEVIKELLNSGISFDQIQSISDDIKRFAEEAGKEKPDESKLKKFFKPIFAVGKEVAVNVISGIFKSPAVTTAISGFITG